MSQKKVLKITIFGVPFQSHFRRHLGVRFGLIFGPLQIPCFIKKVHEARARVAFFLNTEIRKEPFWHPFPFEKVTPKRLPKWVQKWSQHGTFWGGPKCSFLVPFWGHVLEPIASPFGGPFLAHFWTPSRSHVSKKCTGLERESFFWEIEGWKGTLFGHPFLVTFAV